MGYNHTHIASVLWKDDRVMFPYLIFSKPNGQYIPHVQLNIGGPRQLPPYRRCVKQTNHLVIILQLERNKSVTPDRSTGDWLIYNYMSSYLVLWTAKQYCSFVTRHSNYPTIPFRIWKFWMQLLSYPFKIRGWRKCCQMRLLLFSAQQLNISCMWKGKVK